MDVENCTLSINEDIIVSRVSAYICGDFIKVKVVHLHCVVFLILNEQIVVTVGLY